MFIKKNAVIEDVFREQLLGEIELDDQKVFDAIEEQKPDWLIDYGNQMFNAGMEEAKG